jgi:hypothetical protein
VNQDREDRPGPNEAAIVALAAKIACRFPASFSLHGPETHSRSKAQGQEIA